MKKLFLSLLLCSLVSTSQAQTVIDTLAYRFIYDVQARAFEKYTKMNTDEHRLDIGKSGITHYYSFWQSQFFHITDSIYRCGGSIQDYERVRHEKGIEPSDFLYFIFKNYPQRGQQTVDYPYYELFEYQEPMGQDWDFVEGDTIILEHPCQKAICQYHGRTWTAFYATDIPISDGPWKLCGLPGLILRAYDHSNSFIFNCVGIYQNVGGAMTMMNEKRRILKPEQAHKLIEQIDSDPFAYLRSQGISGQSFDEKGRPLDLSKVPKRAYYESYSEEDKK